MTNKVQRFARSSSLLATMIALGACAASERSVHYDCESGENFTVRYTEGQAVFDYLGNDYALPATDKQGDFRRGEMRLKSLDGEVSLQKGDQVVLWGCRPVDRPG